MKRYLSVVLLFLVLSLAACGSDDSLNTDEVPYGGQMTCTVVVNCAVLLDNLEFLDQDKHELVPADGLILPPTELIFSAGETAMDVFRNACQPQGLHYEIVNGSFAYVRGIGNIYEFDVGPKSGWLYTVNGESMPVAASEYIMANGDTLEWLYFCDPSAIV